MYARKNSAVGTQATNILAKCTPDVRRNVVRMLIQVAINSLEGKPVPEGALEKVQSQIGALEPVYDLYTVILNVIKGFLRLPAGQIKADALKEDLKDLKFSEEIITDFINVLYGPKREVLDSALCRSDFHSKLDTFRWQVDITISSSVLARVLEPSVRFDMTLSNGRCYTFEVSISKFHELRYSVASVLKEMESLEKRKLLKGSG